MTPYREILRLHSQGISQRSMALLKLGDKYSTQRLEAACCKALSYTSNPSFKNIQTILANGQDKLHREDVPNPAKYEKYSFTRGADYYDRRSK